MFQDCTWPLPRVNAASSALPGHTQCGLATTLLGWRGVLCPQRLSNTWPGYMNGEVWVLRVNHVSSCLLSLNYPSNKEHRKRSSHCHTTSWRYLKVLTGRWGLRGQFWHHSLRLPGCSASQWLGQALSLQNGRVHRGRSSSRRYRASSYPFSSRALLLCGCVLSCFNRVRCWVTLWTVAHQAPLSMGFSRNWSGFPYPPPGDLPNSYSQSLFSWKPFSL